MFPPEPLPAHPLTVAQAIARVEGWYAIGAEANRPQRNNNPGDLDFEEWMVEKYGATLETGPVRRFACFATAALGWQALADELAGPLYENKTIAEAIAVYAPPSENNTQAYITAVCQWTDLQPTDPVDQA